MFSFFRQSFQMWARSGTKANAQLIPGRKLECEFLEERTLLSLSGAESLVNTTKTNPQKEASVANSAVGKSVVVWTDAKNARDYDIKAQIYDSAGRKVGREIIVANSREHQHSPDVAMDARGNFVVTWEIDFTSTDHDVWARRFRADGTPLGNEFRVAWSHRSEYDPRIAMASNGDFVISYTYQFKGSDSDIIAKMYRANGTLIKSINVADSARAEGQASIAASPDGRFSIAYVDRDDVILKRFNRYGSQIDTTKIAATSQAERAPDVAMDNLGNTVVVYQTSAGNQNIEARRVSASGSIGPVVRIASSSAYRETAPSVALHPTSQRFVVAYQSDTTTSKSVKVTEVSASNALLGTLTVGSGLTEPDVALFPNGSYSLVSHSLTRRMSDTDGAVVLRRGYV